MVQMSSPTVLVIGAGLAGTEAAWQIASAGVPAAVLVRLPGSLASTSAAICSGTS